VRWQETEAAMRAYLGSLSDEDLQGPFYDEDLPDDTYVLWQVIAHVAHHGMQHRSEAAMLLTHFGRAELITGGAFRLVSNVLYVVYPAGPAISTATARWRSPVAARRFVNSLAIRVSVWRSPDAAALTMRACTSASASRRARVAASNVSCISSMSGRLSRC